MASLGELINKGRSQARRALDEECFFENFSRFSKQPYTPTGVAQVLDSLIRGFGGGYTLQQWYDQFIEGPKQDAIIAYEVADDVIRNIAPLTTVKLDRISEEEKNLVLGDEWVRSFSKEYKGYVDEGLIGNQQQAINYVAEHFNNVKNTAKEGLPKYSFKKRLFEDQKAAAVDMGTGEIHDARANKYQPTIDFSDVVGLERQKEFIQVKLFNTIKDPEGWARMKEKPEKVIDRYQFLFHGPPGTGKTYFAKAVGGELKLPFYFLNGSDFIQPLLGEGKNALVSAYEEASRHPNAIMFIDEADAICGRRGDRENKYKNDVLNAMLTILDGDERRSNVITLLSTNRIQDFDHAVLKRFPKDNRLYFGPLTKEMRAGVLTHHLGLYRHDGFDEQQLEELLELMNPEDFRDVRDIVDASARYAFSNKHDRILTDDFKEAVQAYQQGDHDG
ncbi:ATP-binding protein [Candidatus Woesearchaeota archaeon]|nr:ATP-binding protein [Candidatus Woesearchaeota archaeon]